MNKSFKLLRKYKNTKDKTVWKEYKREKNRIRIMLRNEELNYWKDQFAQAKNSYEFWKIVREIQGKNSNKSISTLKDGDGNIITDDLGKAKCLNKFFSSIGKKLADELEETTTELDTKVELIYRVTPTVNEIQLSEKIVEEKLWGIKLKAGGHDSITTKELKMLGSTLCTSLYGIYQHSTGESVQPTSWKIGKVMAAFKKGTHTDTSNYRPITLLTLNNKILESIVCDSIDKHLKDHSLLHENQWGFKKGQSTETMLLFLTETWKIAIDNGSSVGVIFVDFRKAFDTINHDILEYKMIASGISGNLHNWIMNYLTGCKQYVEINSQKLELLIIEIGVPQRSLLGPQLFAIYVNNLPNSSPIGYIHMFADDTTIYYIGNGVEDDIKGLNLILEDFYIWCKKNRLAVHTGKTEVMIITKHPFTGPLQPVVFAGNFIKVVEQSDCLGIKIETDFAGSSILQQVVRNFVPN